MLSWGLLASGHLKGALWKHFNGKSIFGLGVDRALQVSVQDGELALLLPSHGCAQQPPPAAAHLLQEQSAGVCHHSVLEVSLALIYNQGNFKAQRE